MSVPPLRLEESILRSIAMVQDGRWLQCSFGDLRNRISEIDAQAAHENDALIIDALVSLGAEEHLELSKIEADQRIRFDFQQQRDSKYLSQFFMVYPFDLKLTHSGRKRIAQKIAPTLSDEFPTTLEGIRGQIDHWAKRQHEGQPGSEFHSRVTDRLSQLRNLEQRLLPQGSPPTAAPALSKVCIGGFGKYTLGDSIGNGGAGVVYEARTEDDTPCAVKILTTAQGSKAKRFKNEIAYCFRNQHRNVISVWDFGQSFNGKTFYVMPLYGSTLRKLISNGIEHCKILDLFSQMLDGVGAAHQSDVCHRDLKPENILFDETTTTLIVADFGIARFKEEDLQTAIETSDQERLANFQYSAPEQRTKGKAVDQRADIYALGLILNEMFTSDVPQGTGFKRIAAVAPKYGYVDAVIDSMVQQIPEKRLQSISEIRQLLRLNSSPAAKGAVPAVPAKTTELSNEERDTIFEEADVDFAITQGMQQTFMGRFDNKSDSTIAIKKLKLSYNGIKILEAPPRDKKPWQLEPRRSQEVSWEANPDPVVSLMQIQGEWNKPFNLNLEIFIQIEILGRIKTFENRKIFCQVEPSARRIWQRL
jgi:serine/threonine protein kinase